MIFNLEEYLKRMDVEEINSEPNYSLLKELVGAHLCHVPFENLDIINNIPLSLEINRLYQKIVLRRRGGICYELNFLFHCLLEKLGFKSELLAARVFRKKGNVGPKYDHLCLKVKLVDEYLIDVGFGNIMRIPVPLTIKEHFDGFSYYRIRKWLGMEETHLLQSNSGDGWNIYSKVTREMDGRIDISFH